jgi:hypothetical protein
MELCPAFVHSFNETLISKREYSSKYGYSAILVRKMFHLGIK